MPEIENDYRKYANSSGFAFQLRVEEEIRQTEQNHHWKLAGREHFWRNSDEGSEGYADIIIECGILRLAIECKRQLDKSWVFLVTDNRQASRASLLSAVTATAPSTSHYMLRASLWDDWVVTPYSMQSAFCTMQGQADKDRTLLEKAASELVQTVEAIATQELELATENQRIRTMVYGCVIVTTARLMACIVETNDIELATGQLKEGQGRTEEISFIRFRKGLKTAFAASDNMVGEASTELQKLNGRQERTVFVVNANALVSFLQQFKTESPDQFSDYPAKELHDRLVREYGSNLLKKRL